MSLTPGTQHVTKLQKKLFQIMFNIFYKELSNDMHIKQFGELISLQELQPTWDRK